MEKDTRNLLIGISACLLLWVCGLTYYFWPTSNTPVDNDPAIEPLPEMIKQNTLYYSTSETEWRYYDASHLLVVQKSKSGKRRLYIDGDFKAFKKYTKAMRYNGIGLTDDFKEWPGIYKEVDSIVAVKRVTKGYAIKVYKTYMPCVEVDDNKKSYKEYCPVVEMQVVDDLPDDEITLQNKKIKDKDK